jgi:IPT/TIG domain
MGPEPAPPESRPAFRHAEFRQAEFRQAEFRRFADAAGPAPATSPLPWYDEPHQLTFNWGSVIEGGAGALILANALGFSVAASIVGDAAVVAALGAFLPGALLALAFLVAGALLVDAALGLAYGHSGVFGALIDPSGNVVDTNGNAIAGASATVLVSPFAAGPFTAVKANSPGIEPRVNPEAADRSGGFHWDVSAGYYEVRASAPGCHAPGSGATTVASPVFPIPPPKVGLTLVLACSGERPVPMPTVSSVSPAAGAAQGGTTVTISGTGFNRSARVRFGGVPARLATYLSPEALTVVVPAGSGSRYVRVSTAGGTSPGSVRDRYTYYQPPTVRRLSVAKAPTAGGNVVIIYGSGLGNATGVYFGKTAASGWAAINSSEIKVAVPAGLAGPVDVTISSIWGTSAVTPADRLTYTAPRPSPKRS